MFESTLTPFVLAWDIPIDRHLQVLAWISAIFWTIVSVSASAGVYAQEVLEMRSEEVSKHYAKTWFRSMQSLSAAIGST